MTLTFVRADDGLRLDLGGRQAEVSWRWLRDHGEDPESFDQATRQRRIDVLGAAPSPAVDVQLGQIEVDGAPTTALHLRWPDDPHVTWIATSTIERLISPGIDGLATAWRRPDEVTFADLDAGAVLRDDEALREWLRDLAMWGVGRLRGFDGSHEQADALARRIGYARSTIFGALWDLASDIDSHDDTAYTQSFLAPHTDGTYSHDAPGLQMFCCTDRTGTGGESVVVDGLAIAEDLRHDHPEAHRLLTEIDVPAHYIESGVELRASRPAIIDDPITGRFRQISLNNYDRSPMLLDAERMAAFYDAYGLLQRMADDRSRWLAIRLEAGDVLINDNWRVLHGRLAYTGERRFIGCYVNHEDFESRCRTLGLTI